MDTWYLAILLVVVFVLYPFALHYLFQRTRRPKVEGSSDHQTSQAVDDFQERLRDLRNRLQETLVELGVGLQEVLDDGQTAKSNLEALRAFLMQGEARMDQRAEELFKQLELSILRLNGRTEDLMQETENAKDHFIPEIDRLGDDFRRIIQKIVLAALFGRPDYLDVLQEGIQNIRGAQRRSTS